MTTKNIVPRGNGEGFLGTSTKKWDKVYTNDVVLADGGSVTNKINSKANANNVYTKSEADNLLSNKADKATTLAGYGITNAYTKTDVYTKSEANNLLGAKANSTDLSNYLPLSGGAITETIAMKRDVDTDSLILLGGDLSANSAMLQLFGKNSPNYAGAFFLKSTDKNGSDKYLSGYSNGALYWDNKDISCVDSSGTNYIRYTNGLQICWGTLIVPANTGKVSTTVANVFKTGRWVVTLSVLAGWDSPNTVVVSSAIRNTNEIQVNVKTLSNTNPTYDCYIYYVATGYWK